MALQPKKPAIAEDFSLQDFHLGTEEPDYLTVKFSATSPMPVTKSASGISVELPTGSSLVPTPTAADAGKELRVDASGDLVYVLSPVVNTSMFGRPIV